MSSYHKPVLLEESLEALKISPGKTYVDLTYGGGGHSAGILERLDGGRLIAIDQDSDALANKLNDKRLTMIKGNFRFLKNYLRYYDAWPCDGILADLGISSWQIDNPRRGFSIRYDGPLDFRMNRNQQLTGEYVLNVYSVEELARMFRDYGEIRGAGKLAGAIGTYREKQPLKNINQLARLAGKLSPERLRSKYLAKVFQAVRIEVNQEMDALKTMLNQTASALKPGGRLVVIAYHSLEDRMVKNMVRAGNVHGKLEKDFYGNVKAPFKKVNNKVITPSEEEVSKNPRARSARLRIAERL